MPIIKLSFQVNYHTLILTPDNIGPNTLTIESNPKNSVYEINDKNYVVLSGDSSISDYKYISAYPLELYEHKLSTMKLQIIGILLFAYDYYFHTCLCCVCQKLQSA